MNDLLLTPDPCKIRASLAEQCAIRKAWRERREQGRREAKHRPEREVSRLAADRLKRNLPAPTRPCPKHCESCGREPGKRAMHLDHCHVTGKFRGWLCGKCNPAIGMLGDTQAGVKAALRYLQRFDRREKLGLTYLEERQLNSLVGKKFYAARH